ncbi:MAG: hypothetical protein U9R43_01090 [Thermodesulfobacteriota bacterium]|nr:hypothetical protein [Thermodesulfobacteriota bacterium]
MKNKLAVVSTRDYMDEAIAKDIISAVDRNINIDIEWGYTAQMIKEAFKILRR